jgi:DNA polymerase-1
LRAIVVRQVDDCLEIVEGRQVYQALRRAGRDTATVADLGPINRADAILVALSLELKHEIDYVKLGREVAELVAAQGSGFTSIVPFTGVDVGYYTVLSAGFDWSQFQEEDRQGGLFEEPVDEELVDTPQPPDSPEPGGPPPDSPAPVVPKIPTKTGAGSTISAAQRLTAVLDFAPVTPAVAPLAVATPIVDPWDETPAPAIPASPRGGLQFFGAERPVSTWTPSAPPCLDGITDIELDTETTGLRWYAGDLPIGIAIRLPDGHKQYLPWGHTGGNLDETVVKQWAERELRGKHITNQNIRFDIHMMRAWGIDLEAQGCTFSDTSHHAALLDEYRRDFHLGTLAKDYLGLDKTEQDLDKTRMATYHAGDVAAYAENDVHLVGELKRVMWPLLDKEELQRVRQLEDDVIPVVCEMEKNEAHIDRTALRQMVEHSGEILNRSLWEVAKDLGFSMNPDKNEDWQKLFAHYQLPVTTFTEKGAPSFTDKFLETVEHPVVQLARRAGKIASLRSKFLLAYDEVVGDDCKLRFALHQLRGDEYGTIRGRFSMSGGGRGEPKFGANLQQVMRVNSQREAFGFAYDDDSHDAEIYLVRSLFVPEHGEYLSADAQAIEYRLAAHFAEAPLLIEAYQKDRQQLAEGRLTDKWVDFHGVVGEVIRPYKDLSRNIIKNANFCLVYGGGESTATKTMGVTATEGSEIVRVWHRMFPELSKLPKKAENLARTRGYVKTILGRRARFRNADELMWAHAAINYVIQGSAADVMKVKLVELHQARKDTGLLMRMTVHDEVDGDALTPETADKVRVILNRQSFPTLKVPIVWEVSTGKNWAEAH